jgi:hypothetical protein
MTLSAKIDAVYARREALNIELRTAAREKRAAAAAAASDKLCALECELDALYEMLAEQEELSLNTAD